jgi:uncharacterized protein YegP (UPF0339 family)
MKSKNAVLEYKVANRSKNRSKSEARKWGFRFKTPDGKILVESAALFDSYAKAQQGFLGMIKSIATNQYSVKAPTGSDDQGLLSN